MSEIKIIAFIGKIGSGKTTAAKYLTKEYGYLRVRFADKLKRMLAVLGLTYEEIDGSLKNVPCNILGGKTPRYTMITLGTEWGRNMIHPDLWVKALDRQIKELIEEGEYKFVIDDLRFLSESEWLNNIQINNVKIYMIKIVRGEETVLNHQSEIEQDKIEGDCIIHNNDTLESMYKSIDRIVHMYFKEEK